MEIGQHVVPAINNPNLISKTLEQLAKDQPFAVAFFLRQDGKWQFSLRSADPNTPEGKQSVDVSQVAKKFVGGGGHSRAAGFELPLTHLDGYLLVCKQCNKLAVHMDEDYVYCKEHYPGVHFTIME